MSACCSPTPRSTGAETDDTIKTMELQSTIRCPECGFKKEETMPTDACQFFYECTNCGTVLKAQPGDCCVFCSYGSVPCPPKQENGDQVQ